MTGTQSTPATPAITRELNSRWSSDLPLSEPGSPTWEIALNYPRQGEWTEEEYLSLGSNRLIEYSDGVLEFLPMPKPSQARISRYLSDLLRNHVASKNLGEVFWAPFSIRIAATRLREPDILFLSHGRIPEDDVPPDGADLVVEVVSEGNEHRFRDFNTKRSEYAAAGIPEYWIVDPANEVVLVLKLVDGSYQVHGEFRSGQIASSALLPGFEVDVKALYQAAKSTPKPKEE